MACFLLAGLLAMCLTASPALPQQVGSADPEAAQLFAKARPYVEEALGFRLEKLPSFRAVSTTEFRTLPFPEVITQICWQFPDLRGKELKRAVDVVHLYLPFATVARHRAGTDLILVFPNDLLYDVKSRRLEFMGGGNPQAFYQLALVHEATRFALECRYQMTRRLLACADAESFQAMQAMIEGKAQAVTRQVAKKIGTEAYFPLLAEAYLRVPDTAPDGALRAVTQEALHRQHWAMVQGLKWFDALAEHGLRDSDKIFARPPDQLTRISRPDLYVRAQKSGREEMAALLTQMETALPAAEWQAAQQPWTPTMVRQVAAMFGAQKQADKILAAWDEGRTLVWTSRRDVSWQVALSLVRYETATGARSYFGFAVDLQRKQDETSSTHCAESAIRVVDSRSVPVGLRGVDEAVRNERRMQYSPKSAPVTVSTLLVRAGDLVIDLTWQGTTVEPAWAEQIVGAVLAKQAR
jgi:hypothetical protein